jgi:hypothetical protein
MPLQSRVTPFGDIVAISQRGMFTGNRGIIHDPGTRTLLNRRWASKMWLICSCEYKGLKRAVMSGRKWTELFFLDEAVALAAGHRPCFLCRRDAAESFRNAFATARGAGKPSAAEMDDALHVERLACMRAGSHALTASIHDCRMERSSRRRVRPSPSLKGAPIAGRKRATTAASGCPSQPVC